MSVSIQLKRGGRKRSPFYRIIAVDKRDRGTGKFIEILGWYNPLIEKDNLELKKERYDYWINQGAEVSTTIKTLLKKKGISNPVSKE